MHEGVRLPNGNGQLISKYCCEEVLFWRRPFLVKWEWCSREEANGAIKLMIQKKMRIAMREENGVFNFFGKDFGLAIRWS